VLTVSGGKNVTLTAPPTSFMFHQVVLSGGSTMTMNAGGQHVDIYVDNKLDLSGGGIINTGSLPTALGI
jgi:adhesin HecA-like repeat protein